MSLLFAITVAIVSGVAAEKAAQLDEVVGEVQSAVVDFSQAIRGENSTIGAVSNFAKSASALISVFKSDKPKKSKKKKSINKQ